MNHLKSYLKLFIKLDELLEAGQEDSDEYYNTVNQCDDHYRELSLSEIKAIEIIGMILNGNKEQLDEQMSKLDV